jgi:hypothetical protein
LSIVAVKTFRGVSPRPFKERLDLTAHSFHCLFKPRWRFEPMHSCRVSLRVLFEFFLSAFVGMREDKTGKYIYALAIKKPKVAARESCFFMGLDVSAFAFAVTNGC